MKLIVIGVDPYREILRPDVLNEGSTIEIVEHVESLNRTFAAIQDRGYLTVGGGCRSLKIPVREYLAGRQIRSVVRQLPCLRPERGERQISGSCSPLP